MWKQIAVWQVVLSVGFFIYNPVNLSNLYAKKAEISVASMCSLTAGWPGLSFVTNGHTIPHCRRNTHNRHNTIHTTRQKAHTCCLNIFINMHIVQTKTYVTDKHWRNMTKNCTMNCSRVETRVNMLKVLHTSGAAHSKTTGKTEVIVHTCVLSDKKSGEADILCWLFCHTNNNITEHRLGGFSI